MKKCVFLLSCWAFSLVAQEAISSEGSEVAASLLRRSTSASLCSQCDAEPPPPPPKPCIEPGDFSSHLQFGGNYTHVRLTPDGYNSYNGNLGGGQGLYEFRTCRRIYGGVTARWRQGKISGILGNGTLRDGDAEGRIGYTFGRNAYLFSLYTGVGFRYLEQDLQPKGSAAIKYKYEEFYVPIGFLYDCQFTSNFNWGLYGAWMPQIYPSVTIEPIGGCRWITKKTWKNAILAMPFTFACNATRSFTIVFKPFFEYWQDGKTIAKSVTGAPLGVPENTYLFGGADLNLCYSF